MQAFDQNTVKIETMCAPEIIVIGAGFAGSEAAWQIAERGVRVKLYEMRPGVSTGAHQSDRFAELVCSNSLGSAQIDRPSGLLKAELKRLGSFLLTCAEQSAVPAGSALAVDRDEFSSRVTAAIRNHPNIQVVESEVTAIPSGPCIIASGPLTSNALAQALLEFTGEAQLYFFDAIAPIVAADSIDMSIAFRASRRDYDHPLDGDYINCPFAIEQYQVFTAALANAERIQLKSFEESILSGVRAGDAHYFEGCLPIEIIAQRSEKALAFGPLRPVGLRDPRTHTRPHAAVQLRQDNLAGSLYNLVGFQTNLTFAEQRRVFRLIPGLEQAQFERYGQMHRNTFLASPNLLLPTLQSRQREDLFFAGQITGVEGYMGNIATGLLAGINAVRLVNGQQPVELPTDTMLGALCHYVSAAEISTFQPMKANFGLLPRINELVEGKKGRAALHSLRAQASFADWLAENTI